MKNLISVRPVLWFFVLFVLISCRQGIKEEHFSGKALGTTYHIDIQGNGDEITQKEIEELIAQINRSLSTYIPGSLISRINRGEELKADEHFRYVFNEARKIYRATNGLYDPTIGILVNAWGFGPGKKIKNIEHDSTIVDSLKKYVGFDKVYIDQNGVVRKKYPQIFIDFNSIAKGYVIDKIGELISKKSYENYIVELGGEVLAKGKNIKENRPWIVAVDYPVAGSGHYAADIKLFNKAIATSGNYRKYRIDRKTGKKYVHTLHPKTGFPYQSNLLSASVLAPNCTEADGWATACMVSGFQQARKYITENTRLEGLLIYADSLGKIKIWQSDGIDIQKE